MARSLSPDPQSGAWIVLRHSMGTPAPLPLLQGVLMVTLSKRATPSQSRILRIVEGAVLNVADAKGLPRNEWLARSIAKRAAGTLTAQWPEVLAANTRLPVKGAASPYKCLACERRERSARLSARREHSILSGGNARRQPSQVLRRLPLLELWQRLKREMWIVRRSGDQAKYDAYVHLLRMIDKLHRQSVAAENG